MAAQLAENTLSCQAFVVVQCRENAATATDTQRSGTLLSQGWDRNRWPPLRLLAARTAVAIPVAETKISNRNSRTQALSVSRLPFRFIYGLRGFPEAVASAAFHKRRNSRQLDY